MSITVWDLIRPYNKALQKVQYNLSFKEYRQKAIAKVLTFVVAGAWRQAVMDEKRRIVWSFMVKQSSETTRLGKESRCYQSSVHRVWISQMKVSLCILGVHKRTVKIIIKISSCNPHSCYSYFTHECTISVVSTATSVCFTQKCATHSYARCVSPWKFQEQRCETKQMHESSKVSQTIKLIFKWE